MKLYLIRVLMFSLMLFLCIMPVIVFIVMSGEYLALNQVVGAQYGSDGSNKIIYGKALGATEKGYKIEMMSNINPVVVAVGSSRVMQFRDHMFLKDFYNLGGALRDSADKYKIIDEIIRVKPELVIIGADLWWFSGKHKMHGQILTSQNNSDKSLIDKINISHVAKVINWTIRGEISIDTIYATMQSGFQNGIGIRGLYGDGFARDGSVYYTRVITGQKRSHDVFFSDSLKRIDKGVGQFKSSNSVDQDAIDSFVSNIYRLLKNDIGVVVFLPPYAQELFNEMAGNSRGDFGYIVAAIDALKKKLSHIGINLFDFTDPSLLESNSCEFIDGLHGGEVTYMRALLFIAEAGLLPYRYVSKTYLKERIDSNRGYAFVSDHSVTTDSEVDFLKLGCVK